ncbi:hypothetical protein PSYMP_25174 [Pseudomonas amygdali pv. morsprunorum str. M302280]|nr:hypothetical protein PSYMP_25174 [Pseudomonas amygdali pv. morsprunorum str. M302280]
MCSSLYHFYSCQFFEVWLLVVQGLRPCVVINAQVLALATVQGGKGKRYL